MKYKDYLATVYDDFKKNNGIPEDLYMTGKYPLDIITCPQEFYKFIEIDSRPEVKPSYAAIKIEYQFKVIFTNDRAISNLFNKELIHRNLYYSVSKTDYISEYSLGENFDVDKIYLLKTIKNSDMRYIFYKRC